MSNISELEKCPELNFIEHMTLSETEEQLRTLYRQYYRELTGEEAELGEADTVTLLLRAFCAVEYQTMQYVDAKGRAEMLNTSTGDALDALAALVGLTRKEPTRATATVRFTLSAVRETLTVIPAGTRVRTEGGTYFDTVSYTEIAPGEAYADLLVRAEAAGEAGNGAAVGEIRILVDPIPYVASVENTTESTGGLDTEDDDSLTRRVYLAPSAYSCAGPRDAYEYYARAWRADVADVRIVSPSPCVVNIYFVISDEEGLRVPNATELGEMRSYLSGEDIRPLCDAVDCVAPTEKEYAVAFTYYIASSDSRSAGEIQSRVTAAVDEFTLWQRKLGRDLNPTELVARLREAGAKRVTLTEPVHTVVSETELPKCTGVSITYGGLEDD